MVPVQFEDGRWGGRRRDHYDRERRDDISEDEDVETACD